MKATWNGVTIAESDDTVLVEGNHYFPMSSLNRDFVTFSNHKTTCPWKGTANYYSLLVNGDSTPTPPGTTPIRSPKPKRSATASRSGRT